MSHTRPLEGLRKSRTRPPAVAGMFYPADPSELEQLIAGCLKPVAQRAQREEGSPKAVIAPHAGYLYSGPIAASAYAPWARDANTIERIVLLGPAHRALVQGLAAPSVDAFETPLGRVPLDRDAIEQLLALPQLSLDDAAHAAEHSLEVQLPFLQLLLGSFCLVPLAVGQATPEQVAEVLEASWGGLETRIVVSSDLSHYYDYETARRIDAETSRAIQALDPDGLDRESACGRVPIRGLLVAARRHGLCAQARDLRSSGDTAGSRGEVVGYGAFVFS